MSAGKFPTLSQLLDELKELDEAGRLRGGAAKLKGGGRFRFTQGLSIGGLNWPGLGHFWLTRDQQKVVAVLMEAFFESSNPDVGEKFLLSALDGKYASLAKLFARTETLGTLIIRGRSAGSYRLAPMSGSGIEDEDDTGKPEEWIEYE